MTYDPNSPFAKASHARMSEQIDNNLSSDDPQAIALADWISTAHAVIKQTTYTEDLERPEEFQEILEMLLVYAPVEVLSAATSINLSAFLPPNDTNN